MSKPFHYWTRFTLALTLSATLVVSPVWAGRIFKHRSKARAADCCVVVPSNCCESPVVESQCCGEVVQPVDPCGCNGTVVTEAPSIIQPSVDPTPAPQEHAPATPPSDHAAPSEHAPTPPPVIESQPESTIPQSPFSEPAPTPAPQVEQPTPTPDPLEQPTPAAPQAEPAPAKEAPAQEPLFPAEPAPTPAPSNETPAEPAPAPTPAPADDIFANPAEQPKQPAKESTDDVFGNPEPAPSKEPAAEDLFGTPEPTPQPAAQGTDIFGTPEAAPAPTSPAPATPPANEPALDNLFGDPAPAEKAAEPAADPANSLFDAPADEKKEKTDNTNNLFDSSSTQAPAESAPVADAGASGVDDLFGSPASATEKAPEAKSGTTPTSKDGTDLELDKLFDSSDVRSPEGKFTGAEVRVWIDNTGNFTTTGRLITIFANEVRLLKDNGKTTTVPLRRLSQADMDYVKSVYVALNSEGQAKEFFVQHENGQQLQNELTR